MNKIQSSPRNNQSLSAGNSPKNSRSYTLVIFSPSGSDSSVNSDENTPLNEGKQQTPEDIYPPLPIFPDIKPNTEYRLDDVMIKRSGSFIDRPPRKFEDPDTSSSTPNSSHAVRIHLPSSSESSATESVSNKNNIDPIKQNLIKQVSERKKIKSEALYLLAVALLIISISFFTFAAIYAVNLLEGSLILNPAALFVEVITCLAILASLGIAYSRASYFYRWASLNENTLGKLIDKYQKITLDNNRDLERNKAIKEKAKLEKKIEQFFEKFLKNMKKFNELNNDNVISLLDKTFNYENLEKNISQDLRNLF